MSRSTATGQDQSPFEDDYRGFDVRDDEAARGPVILALAIGVLVIFGAVVWNTYRAGIRPEGEGLPSVIADPEPYKQVPADPGGVAVPNTDKRFYDDMDATSRDPAAPVDELAGSTPVAAGVPAPEPVVEADIGRGPVEPVTELSPAALAEPPSAPAVAPPVTALAAVPAVPAAEPQGPRARYTFAADGDFLVQIAALQSEEAADSAWKRVTTNAPELYHGANKDIQRADRGAEGVVYRLRVGAFADRSEAKAFCAELSASGAQCFVVKK